MASNKKYLIRVSIAFGTLIFISAACSSLGQSGDSDDSATQAALLATYTALQAQELKEEPQLSTSEPIEIVETEEVVAAEPLVVPVQQEQCDLQTASVGTPLWSTDFDSEDCLTLFAISNSQVDKSDYIAEISEDGSYSFRVNRNYTSVYAVAEHVILPKEDSDVKVDVALDYLEGPNEVGFSLLCRVNPAGWYEFLVTSGGRWQIMRTRDSGVNFDVLASGGIDFRHYGLDSFKQGSYNFQASCIGNELTLSVNDIPVNGATVRDLTQTHQAGSVGFALFTLDSIWDYAENPAVVSFNSFEVRRP